MLPKYMEPGSKGPLVVALLAFLAGYPLNSPAARDLKARLEIDDEFGDVGSGLLAELQNQFGLEADGSCGPKTRPVLSACGFDMERVALHMPGTTLFVQPGGATEPWTSPAPMTPPIVGTVECLGTGGRSGVVNSSCAE